MGKKSERRKKRVAKARGRDGRTIQLVNPVSEHFKGFIIANATKCDRVVEKGSAKGEHIVICGAGPSLREHVGDGYLEDADQVWGCNSAAIWLHDNGHRVTHGFTVDQTPQLVGEWASAPPLEYLVASSVHPHLIELLESKGRRITFFHNYVGINERPVDMGDDVIMPYEDWMYYTYYPETVRAGSGLNAVTRALDIALIMGASRITLLGADSALRVSKPLPDEPDGSPAHKKWLKGGRKGPPPQFPAGSAEHTKWLTEDCEMHVDGGHALASGATAVTVEGEIDGRFWVTKPDMMISAIYLARMVRHFDGRIEVIGDTLPNALKDKDDEFLDALPNLATKGGDILRYTPPSEEMVEMV